MNGSFYYMSAWIAGHIRAQHGWTSLFALLYWAKWHLVLFTQTLLKANTLIRIELNEAKNNQHRKSRTQDNRKGSYSHIKIHFIVFYDQRDLLALSSFLSFLRPLTFMFHSEQKFLSFAISRTLISGLCR